VRTTSTWTLERRGKKPQGKTFKSALHPRVCKCGAENPSTALFCNDCNYRLRPDAVAERERKVAAEIDEAVARRIATLMRGQLPEELRKALDAGQG
jgi:ribosomal protein L40E